MYAMGYNLLFYILCTISSISSLNHLIIIFPVNELINRMMSSNVHNPIILNLLPFMVIKLVIKHKPVRI